MQFTEEIIQDILRENEQLKTELNIAKKELGDTQSELSATQKELSAAQKELDATAALYDTMVVGTKNLLILTEGGSRSAIYVTPNVEEILGLPRDLAMRDIRELGPLSGEIPSERLFADRSETGPIVRAEVECIDRKTGQSKPYHRVVTKIEPRNGVDRYLSVYYDAKDGTSDSSRLHEILVEGVAAAHNQMLKGMSHDLRTPLNSIAGYVMLLMKNPENSAKVMEYAHRIGMATQDLLVMINQIMDLSGSEKNGQEVYEREFALGKTIEEISDVVRSKAQARHQRFEVRIEGIRHDIFVGDRIKIAEILMNLLNNALQYTQEGGDITLAVTAKKDEDPEYQDISFEISDNGIGMSSELQKRLFDNNTDNINAIPGMLGSGIGITMTKKFVAQLGGTISVQSTLGQGTTFSVGLRLKSVGNAADNFWSERGIRRILVVGENMNEAARICDLLENTGLDTEYTSSGYGALQLIEQTNVEDNGFDLLIMDRDIQDKRYREVSDEIREMPWKKQPVIILLSDKAEHFTQNVHKEGIDAIITKPFFFSTFCDAVEKLRPKKESNGAHPEVSFEHPLSGLRFLVAEDNAINADVLKELLEVEGARCELAGNGKAAVAMFKNSKPFYYDMILMDIRMPLMDGYAATAEIRKLRRKDARLPILAMTADALEEDRERSLACGMDEHIPKPLDIRVINQAVHKLRTRQ